MKKILIISNLDTNGGVGNLVMKLCHKMDSSLFTFDFLYYEEPSELVIKEIKKLGGIFYLAPRYSKSPLKFIIFIHNFYKQNVYDVVHIHGSTAMLMTYVIPLWFKSVKIIYHSHASMGNPQIMQYIFRYILNKKCTLRIAVSEDAAQWMYGKRICKKQDFVLLKNGIDVNKFVFNSMIRQVIRENLEIPKDTILLGHIGRFVSLKNHLFIIEVFDKLVEKNKNSKLLLIGEGPLKNEVLKKVIQKKLGEQVIFYDGSNNIYELLQAMDVFIFPSLHEGLGIVAIEAQCSGLPVLASENIPKEAEILNNYNTLSLSISPIIWAEQIIRASINSDRRDVSKEINAAGYNIEQSVAQLEKIYTTI